MEEKKKLYVILGSMIGLFTIILIAYIITTIQFNKKLKDIDEKMKEDTIHIFYLSRPTCHYCTLLEPITETLKQEYNLNYDHINVDQYSNNQLEKMIKKFGVNPSNFGTPYIAITKNGQVLEELNGYADENVVFEFFQKAGVIPKEATLSFDYIDYPIFQNLWKSEEKQCIMIGETGNESVKARNQLKPLIQENQLLIHYMDIAETNTNENYAKFLEMIGYSNEPTYPILMIVQNGTIIAQTNATTKEQYQTFFKNQGYMN